MATIKEVAKIAQVSPTTVSHVINNTRFVSDEIRERVFSAMQYLEYQPNALARSLRSGKTYTIGLLLPDSANPFFAEIGREIEIFSSGLGYSLILCNTEGDPKKENSYLNVLYNKRVDGIILVSVGIPTLTFQFLQDKKVPLVAVDRDYLDLPIDTVLVNNRRGAELAVNHLIKLGHRSIACVAGPSSINPSADRVTGYKESLKKAGIPIREDLIVTGDFHPESGWKAGLDLLRREDRPTAIFTCNDLMGIGVLRAASEIGLSVPEDVSVIGYDDIELASYTNPGLTTIGQPKREIARLAVEILMKRIDSSVDGLLKETLNPQLIERLSCGVK